MRTLGPVELIMNNWGSCSTDVSYRRDQDAVNPLFLNCSSVCQQVDCSVTAVQKILFCRNLLRDNVDCMEVREICCEEQVKKSLERNFQQMSAIHIY